MKITEFTVHGVPQGYDVWGSSGNTYYESFYNILDKFQGAVSALVVEVRKEQDLFYSYYTYIRSANIVAEGGRAGSYFGMTFKIENEYCTDVYSLFQLFELLYSQKVLGKVLAKNGNVEKYLVQTFANVENDLTELSGIACNQLSSKFQSDWEKIDNTFTKQKATSSIYFNTNDIDCQSFFNATKEYGKVMISSVYPTKDSIIANCSATEKQLKAVKKGLEEQIETLKRENLQIADLRRRESSLSHELENTKAQMGKLSNLDATSRKFEPALKEMLDLLRIAKPYATSTRDFSDEFSNRHSSRSKQSKFDGLIPYVIAILAIAAAIFMFSKWNGAKGKIDSLQNKLDNCQKENTELLKAEPKANHEKDTVSLQSEGKKEPTKKSKSANAE